MSPDQASDKVKGPASYVPSIEARHGRPLRHWLDLVAGMKGTHMQRVTRLQAEHGLGHGHANAVVAHAPRKDAP